jgi:hypothetical protein
MRMRFCQCLFKAEKNFVGVFASKTAHFPLFVQEYCKSLKNLFPSGAIWLQHCQQSASDGIEFVVPAQYRCFVFPLRFVLVAKLLLVQDRLQSQHNVRGLQSPHLVS